MAQPDRTRLPVAVGEAKWTKRVDAARTRNRLAAKAAALTKDFADLRYLICARQHVDSTGGELTITAADIFAP